MPKGILVLVCPLKALAGNRPFCTFLDAHYDELGVYKFPDGYRPYNEIVVIGQKRREAIPAEDPAGVGQSQLHQFAPANLWRALRVGV